MVNNYLKVLARVKTPTGQPGAVVRKRYFPFDDESAMETVRARTEAVHTRDEFKSAGLIPVMSLHRPCSLISRGDGDITLIGECVESVDGR